MNDARAEAKEVIRRWRTGLATIEDLEHHIAAALAACREPKAPTPQAGYNDTVTVFEGTLDVHQVNLMRPIQCSKHCEPFPQRVLTGLCKNATGATSLAYLEHCLQALNGKQVKLTIEWVENQDRPTASQGALDEERRDGCELNHSHHSD